MKSFKSFLQEKVLSIGLNPDHEKYREIHRSQIRDVLRKSYENIGGYSGFPSGSKEESDSIDQDISDHVIKAVKRKDKITSVNIYKKQHGLKSIASGTDGSEQGKIDFKKTKLEDHEHQRAWGEVSGAVEKIQNKIGFPKVKSIEAQRLLGKPITPVPGDEYKYTRKIGDLNKEKVIMGYPKT